MISRGLPVLHTNDRHGRALRAKLQDGWHKPRYFETVVGAGYRFVPTGELR